MSRHGTGRQLPFGEQVGLVLANVLPAQAIGRALEMSSESFELRWVRPPRQDRSRDTHMRYVEAAQRLLARGRSFSETSVAELAKEAQSSVGAFYSRFRDKDALVFGLLVILPWVLVVYAIYRLVVRLRGKPSPA